MRKHNFISRFAVVLACLGIVLLAPMIAKGELASALLREGEELEPGETINALSNTAVNHVGGYACSLNTTGTDLISRIWGNSTGGAGMLLRTESTIGDFVQTSFESFYGMGDSGQLGYGATSDNTNTAQTGLDGVWLDDAIMLNEEDPVPSLSGQWSTFNSRPTATGSGTAWWIGGISNTLGGSTQNRCLFRGAGATVEVMGGDFLPGVTEPVSTSSTGVDFDFRVSRNGTNWINLLNVTSSTTNDGVMVINGVPIMAGGSIMRENSPVPSSIGGKPGELWDNFDYLGINEAGDYFVTGDTTYTTTEDEFVLLNGEIVLREGAELDLDGMSATVNGAIEGGYMNKETDWAVIWDVDETGVGNVEALIVNGEIVLVEGDAVDWNGNGVIDPGDENGVISNFTGISSVSVSARDGIFVNVYFTADIGFDEMADLEGFFCLRVQVVDVDWQRPTHLRHAPLI